MKMSKLPPTANIDSVIPSYMLINKQGEISFISGSCPKLVYDHSIKSLTFQYNEDNVLLVGGYSGTIENYTDDPMIISVFSAAYKKIMDTHSIDSPLYAALLSDVSVVVEDTKYCLGVVHILPRRNEPYKFVLSIDRKNTSPRIHSWGQL